MEKELEKRKEFERKIVKYLKQLKEEGKILDWEYRNYKYWNHVLAIQLTNGNWFWLAKTYIYMHSLHIYTIQDSGNITTAKAKINKVISMTKELENEFINDFNSLEQYELYENEID